MTRDACISTIVCSVSLALALCLAASFAQSSEIHEAAADGNIKRVRDLLAKDPTLANAKDRFGSTPLHWAAAEGHGDVVKLLLSNKADVNARSGNLITPLGSAAHRGQADVVKLLISNGANVDLADDTDLTPLATASFRGYKQIVEILLANNAKVNVKDEHGSTPLHEAAAGGNKEIVSLLLANKADVNAPDIEGRTPISYAQTDNHPEIVELLLQHGATELSSTPCVSDDIKCSEIYTVSAEKHLAEVKASVLATFKSLERERFFAQEESDKWEEHAQLEQDSRMKSVTYGFRDAFSSHAKGIDQITEHLRELGRIGEDLELRLEFLWILQADLEGIQQGKLASHTITTIAGTKEGIGIAQEGVSVSGQALKIAQTGLGADRSVYRKRLV
jgi:ankyrin repeat protein